MKTKAIVLAVPVAAEDVEHITARNQNRRKSEEARAGRKKKAQARNAAAAAGIMASLLLAVACAAVGPWWTAVSPIAMMVGVMRKAGWV